MSIHRTAFTIVLCASAALASACTSEDAAKGLEALASSPIVEPIGYGKTIATDQLTVALTARILNRGISNATGPFTVEMQVIYDGPNGSVGESKTITVPASSTVEGTQSAGSGGGTLLTDAVVTVPYMPATSYNIQIWIDRDGARFGYLDAAFKHGAWVGKLVSP